jgi:hypothetical protein
VPAHYERADNGICVLKPCRGRVANNTEHNYCGDGCVLDSDNLCKEECGVGKHYFVNDRGVCTERLCFERQPDCTVEGAVCGSGTCVKSEDSNNLNCSESCVTPEFFRTNERKECKIIENCAERSVKDNAIYKCGYDGKCVVNEKRVCASSCINENHYRVNENLECVISSCSTRTYNEELYCNENCLVTESYKVFFFFFMFVIGFIIFLSVCCE